MIACAFCAKGMLAHATELMNSATQLGEKKVHTEVYFRHLARQDLTITVGGGGTVNVKGSTLTGSSSSDLESEGNGQGAFAKVSFQPFESGVRYYLLGGTGNYDLKIPSGSFSNSFNTDNPGFVIGGGIKYTLVPYTIVSPALSIDLSATHSHYKLTRFRAGDGKAASNDSGFLLTILELQAALTVSKKFIFNLGDYKASFDPYLGVKVIRTRAALDALSSDDHFTGTRTGLASFFGVKFKPFPYEGLVIEGSVLNEFSASVGLTLGF